MGTPRRASRLQVDFEPWDDNDTEPYQISTLHVILNFVLYVKKIVSKNLK